ncbi:MAG: response regulator [Chloroflexota bacterium]|nr:response regulator [Chloroflexota bacterium]
MYSALVVDDNEHNRRIFRIALEHAGYAVVEAEDGLGGLQAFHTGKYQLLIVDLAMPTLDGVALLTQLCQSPAWNKPVVIVVTANPHMATSAVEQVADYILQKPIDVRDFAQLSERVQKQFRPR